MQSLPDDMIRLVACYYYQTKEKLLTFLRMSLICKTFRRGLDAVSSDQEKRYIFLARLSKKNTIYFGETMDFNYMIEKQLIIAFEMSYRLRTALMQSITRLINLKAVDVFYASGCLQLNNRCDDFLAEATILVGDNVYFDDSIFTNHVNYPPTILLKALSNLNYYIKSILHAELVFRHPEQTAFIKSPYDTLDYDCRVYIIPSNTTTMRDTTCIGGKLFES
jgi:hypothetical protein